MPLAKKLGPQLWGIAAGDPTIFAAVSAGLLLGSALGCVAAMRPALKVDTAARRAIGKTFALHSCVNDKATSAPKDEKELTEPEKRANVVRLAFDDDPAKLDRFVELIKGHIPEKTGVVLRGSAVTGFRWKDGLPFDADGPGTSDLDLTFVGQRILEYYKVTGFFVPGVHSRPISKHDPDIAPDLIPLREALMAMVKRPVNIQGTRDFVMYLRGELLGQPYLTLVEKSDIE